MMREQLGGHQRLAGRIRITIFLCLVLCACPATFSPAAENATTVTNPALATARIRYACLKESATLKAPGEIIIRSGNARYRVDAGTWTFGLSNVRPPSQRYHVFSKTFQPGEERQRDEYLASWRSRGYTPEISIFGRLFESSPGRKLDNSEFWVSLARYDSEQDAKALVETLKRENIWAWVRSERTAPGSGVFSIQGQGRRASDRLAAPLTLECTDPVEVEDISSGFWKERKANRKFQGPLTLAVGINGEVEVYGDLPIETYLRGVIPAEMPAGWPLEALKAQAVVARSEIYASLAGKYLLEGFDFTAMESCRAYAGVGGYTSATDQAVAATAGMALTYGGEFVKAVFSSCCGGWTEDNENVWSGPPNPMLRGLSDLRPGAGKSTPASDLTRWLSAAPSAWCSDDADGYRWQRRYTVKEVSDLVNKKHRVGNVQSIREGTRGVSGRLKSITITGSVGSVTLDSELEIRQAFGGLPSAMVIIRPMLDRGAPVSFTFTGGGRGHGVGMCQYGARGMASSGQRFEEIVAHYFPGATLERTER